MYRDASLQDEPLAASRCVRFLQEVNFYLAAYAKSETTHRRDLTTQLVNVGKEVRSGGRTWSKQDLDDIASWKGLRSRMLMTETNSSDLESRLENALRKGGESSRIHALCDIRGIGPIMASTLLMFTWPETYGFMDNRTYNSLRYLGFNFPKKYSTSRFTVNQLLAYLRAIRALKERGSVSAMEIAEALYALDSVTQLHHEI